MFTYPYLAKASLGLSLVFALIQPALSQISANGAGTVVNPQGNQIHITGGTQAGGNLFHSFQDFNVNSNQVANFLSNPQTQNIFGRINGGNPSFINGLLQVTRGNSNLFLMNPAGIIFGQGASLNVPASFTATTANQIGFGNHQYFSAVGENNYAALVGNPNSFLFTTNESGSIVNAGDLAVTSGQSISLVGGNIVNTGNVNAGNITLAAVPGTNRVRISQPGHLLSLEITPSADSLIAPLDLPRLLTGQSLPGIRSDGEMVEVNGMGIPAGQGVNVTAGNLSLASSPLPVGEGSGVRAINILGDRVALLGANLNASGVDGGGTIRVGGEYRGGGNNPFNSRITYVDAGSFLRADALNAGDGGRVIIWGDDVTRFYGNISARGGVNGGNGGFAEVSGAQTLTFAGNADLSAPIGSFGTLLLDPTDILISNGADALGTCVLSAFIPTCGPGAITISQTNLETLSAAADIILEATNNITFGTLTGGSLDFTACTTDPCGKISFTAGGAFNTNGNNITASGRNLTITAASITAAGINTSTNTANRNGGNITLTANSGNITTADINSRSRLINSNAGNGGAINLNARNGIVTTNYISSTSSSINNNSSDAGNITINAQSISTGAIEAGSYAEGVNTGNGGAINLTAGSNINTSSIDTSTYSEGVNAGNSGAINLTAGNNINTSSISSTSGEVPITLNAGGNITTSSIEGAMRPVTLNAAGNINTSNVFSRGGNINLTAGGNITTSGLDSNFHRSGVFPGVNNYFFEPGGAINLNAPNGSITVGYLSTESVYNTGGNATITAGSTFLATGSPGLLYLSAENYINLLLRLPRPVTGLVVNVPSSISTQGEAGNGTLSISHGGGTSVPFVVGGATVNGTAAAIVTGRGANTITNLTVPAPPEINTYGTNITIRTTAPEPISPISILIPLLTNPEPPPTPNPVIVGTPPILVVDPIPVAPTINPLLNTSSTIINPPVNISSTGQTVIVLPTINNPTVIVPPIINNPTIVVPPTINIVPPTINIVPPTINNPTIVVPPPSPTNPQLSRPILDFNSPGAQSPVSLAAPNSSIPIIDRIPVNSQNNKIRLLDDPFKQEFQAYSGISDEIATLDVNQAQEILQRIIRETNAKPVFIYVFFAPENDTERTVNSARGLSSPLRVAQDTDILEVVLVPPTGDLVRVKHPGLKRPDVMNTAQRFVSLTASQSNGYIGSARQFHEWIITPLQDELKKREIDNLVFLMDVGLRSIPIAAMRDKQNGDRFLIEDYSVGLMPSLTLTDTTYTSLRGSEVLGMGAATFVGANPLPGVPLELNAINQIWGGNTLINENFTLSNLSQVRRPAQRIVHLATHGVFAPGEKSNSYIQLWGNERLTLDQIRQAGWGDPPVDLLVLSACQTALGDRESELGFAGLAVQAGVKSALASLWLVSDEGTLGLMTEFYKQLQETTTKSEALRQAQLAMLRGEVRLEGGNLVTPQGKFPLNEELRRLGDRSLRHPYFWSGFTMVGNPW